MTVAYPFPLGNTEHNSYSLLHAWWKDLDNDRGERASLRRAGTLTEVILSPAFHRLLQSLRRAGFQIAEQRYQKLAIIAGITARLKEISGPSLGIQCGSPHKSSHKPDVAELRMRRLLSCDDLEELYSMLRRVLALLGNQANLTDLAAIIWNWKRLDERHPFDPRRRLAIDYYEALPM